MREVIKFYWWMMLAQIVWIAGIVLFAFWATGQSVTLTWDIRPQENPRAWHVYEIGPGTNVALRAVVTTNSWSDTNYAAITQRVFAVAVSNIWGLGPRSTNIAVPVLPSAPTNVVATTIAPLQVMLPGTVEMSRYLAQWSERVTIAGVTGKAVLTFKLLPTESSMFVRVASQPPPPQQPPIP